jgi:cation:H+ antiporter
MQLISPVLLILLGLLGLYFGGNWLVGGAARLARSFRISPLIVGLTVVAVGTSAPELLVSVDAALAGASDLALGNVIGSNIANIGLVLGVSALITALHVQSSTLRREIPYMIGASILTMLLSLDGEIGRTDGLLLVAGFVAFTGYFIIVALREGRSHHAKVAEAAKERVVVGRVIVAVREAHTLPSAYTAEVAHRVAQDHPETAPAPADDDPVTVRPEDVNRPLELGRVALGIVLLVAGANWLVSGAITIAQSLGVPEIVIGITLVAVGTSLPELAASVVAALKKQADIVLGNIVGSNIANLLLILGVTAIILPIPVEPGLAQVEMPVMIGFALLLVPFGWNQWLGRRAAIAFLGGYVGFIAYVFLLAG